MEDEIEAGDAPEPQSRPPQEKPSGDVDGLFFAFSLGRFSCGNSFRTVPADLRLEASHGNESFSNLSANCDW